MELKMFDGRKSGQYDTTLNPKSLVDDFAEMKIYKIDEEDIPTIIQFMSLLELEEEYNIGAVGLDRMWQIILTEDDNNGEISSELCVSVATETFEEYNDSFGEIGEVFSIFIPLELTDKEMMMLLNYSPVGV